MQENNAKSFVDPAMVERLNQIVRENYKSKKAFAADIGASYEIVRLWCIGKSKPNSDFMRVISEKAHVQVDWLVTGNNPNAQPNPPQESPQTWQDKALHEAMQKQIDLLAGIVGKYEKTNQDMWGVINAQQAKIDAMSAALLNLTNDVGQELGWIKRNMISAAQHNDIRLLEIVGGSGK